MAACRFCVYYLLKCLYLTKETVIIFICTLMGTVAALTAAQMLFVLIPSIAYYSDKSRLDLPEATRG